MSVGTADRGRSRALAAIVAAGCLAAYVPTLAPGLCFPAGDSHELTVNAARLGVPHPSGYPIWTWVAFLFQHFLPLGEPAWRLNLLSALLGATAVGMLVPVGRYLGLPPLAAAASAALLGLSRTFWSQAVITEIYTADVLALVVTVWLVLRWAAEAEAQPHGRVTRRRFVAFAVAYGLSLGTHLSNLLFAPVFAVFALLVDPGLLRRWRMLTWAGAAFVVTAAQYLWLPLRGDRFDTYPNIAPTSVDGFLGYTVLAFRDLRFAFPISALPWRVVLALHVLVTDLTVVGCGLALAGSWLLLAADPIRSWLLGGIFLVNVAVFSQFAVPDPDVFFLPAVAVGALWAGYGAAALWERTPRSFVRPRVRALVAVSVVLGGLVSVAVDNRRVVGRRTDTGAEDFARSALAMVPHGTVLISPRGAFGADLVYLRDVIGLRPDVLLPGQGPLRELPPQAPRFSTVALAGGRPTPTGRLGQPPDLLPEDAWYVPVLLGWRAGQVLARLQPDPPRLIVEAAPRLVQFEARVLGRTTLAAAEVRVREPVARPRIHLRTWWRIERPEPIVVSTRLAEHTLESHELGLGNLLRYAETVGWSGEGFVLEDVDLAIPSTFAAGRYAMKVGVTAFDTRGFVTDWTDVGHVDLP